MIRVLIVDDDFMVASIHRGFVEAVSGFSVVGEAHTAADAVRSAVELQPDLVLLDIYLPDQSGITVMQALHDEAPGVDVMAVTAARDVETLRSAMRLGATHYLVKPFTFQGLRDKLQQYARYADRLSRTTISSQAEVDRLVSELRTEEVDRVLPKGLSDDTMELIEAVLDSAAGAELSAAEVGEQAGVSRVTARRYLDHLHTIGRVKRRARYGSSGRPMHLYLVEHAAAGGAAHGAAGRLR